MSHAWATSLTTSHAIEISRVDAIESGEAATQRESGVRYVRPLEPRINTYPGEIAAIEMDDARAELPCAVRCGAGPARNEGEVVGRARGCLLACIMSGEGREAGR